jgi:hypothetical protein
MQTTPYVPVGKCVHRFLALPCFHKATNVLSGHRTSGRVKYAVTSQQCDTHEDAKSTEYIAFVLKKKSLHKRPVVILYCN